MNRIRFRLLSLAVIIASLVPLSCRTYGGYGSEEAIREQIEAAYQSFERDLVYARNDLQALMSRSADDELAGRVTSRMEEIIVLHETMLAEHQRLVQKANDGTTYRALKRTFGGMLADHHFIYLRYTDLRAAMSEPDTTRYLGQGGEASRRYHVLPPFYERIRNASYMQRENEIPRLFRSSDSNPAQPSRTLIR